MASISRLPLSLFHRNSSPDVYPSRSTTPTPHSITSTPSTTQSIEILTMALALSFPLTTASVTSHPAYRILYNSNPTALSSLITYATGIAYEDVGKNSTFTASILSDEKGGSFNYSFISFNLTRLHATAPSTPGLSDILDSIEKLIAKRETWLDSGTRYFSFDVWYLMTKNCFINYNDAELTALLGTASEAAAASFLHFQTEFSRPASQIGYRNDSNKLRNAYVTKHRELRAFKDRMQGEYGSFKNIHKKIDEHLRELDKAREEEKLKQKERLVKRVHLRQRTLALNVHQMGQSAGAAVAIEAQDALQRQHEELFGKHLETEDEEELDEEAKKKYKEWQKEMLGREYNQRDSDCQRLHSSSLPQPRLRKRQPKRYVIKFGDGNMKADDVHYMGSQSPVSEERPTMMNAMDLATVRSMSPASNVFDKQTLQWMKRHYGQRNVIGVRQRWRSLFGIGESKAAENDEEAEAAEGSEERGQGAVDNASEESHAPTNVILMRRIIPEAKVTISSTGPCLPQIVLSNTARTNWGISPRSSSLPWN